MAVGPVPEPPLAAPASRRITFSWVICVEAAVPEPIAERVSRDKLPIAEAGPPINGASDSPRSDARAYRGV